jgi:hypothetical protein
VALALEFRRSCAASSYRAITRLCGQTLLLSPPGIPLIGDATLHDLAAAIASLAPADDQARVRPAAVLERSTGSSGADGAASQLRAAAEDSALMVGPRWNCSIITGSWPCR